MRNGLETNCAACWAMRCSCSSYCSRNMITVAKVLLMFIICKVHQLLIT